MKRVLPVLGMSLFLAAVAAAPAHAQYFGQNKVQHRNFDFQVLATEHFDIYYYPQEADAAAQVGRMAERWYARFRVVLGHDLTGRQPLVLYASHPEFEQTNVIEGPLGEGTGGVTEGGRRRIVLPMAATLADTDHVVGHEIVHAFQYDMLGPTINAMPLWAVEGMAEYLSLGPTSWQTAMWLRDAAYDDRLPDLDGLNDPRNFPYRFGHAFWAYVGGRWGDGAIGQILNALAVPDMAPDFVGTLQLATGVDAKTLVADWHKSIRQIYDIAEGAGRPGRVAGEGVVIGERTDNGRVNVGPALSPDGRRVAFLSSRNQLSIDVYLADTSDGHVIRQLTKTAGDPHFDSLQFLASAGTWSPDGKRLALATVRNGYPALAIFDAENGDRLDEARFETLGEIFNPAWSPDGTSIAFSGQAGGFTNLYVYTLASRDLKQLTSDPFADLQPVWSPDGRQLAFVTERFSSSLDTLSLHGLRLARLTVADGTVTPVETGLSADAFDPQWSADGRELYFLSPAGGRANAYRVALGTDTATRFTAAATSVSGITPSSPALSVAADGSRAAVSVFRDRGFEIQVIGADALAASLGPAPEEPPTLPPAPDSPGLIAQALAKPAEGLPAPTAEPKTEPYSPGLQLVGVGQQAGVATSSFGTYFTGGIVLQFSDVLGEHLLNVGIAANGGVKDIGGSASYLNRTRRWNWGVFGERLPIASGAAGAGFVDVNGQTVFQQQTLIFRETYTQVGGLVAYPFSRTMRVEFNTAWRHIGFDEELRTTNFDPVTGQILSDMKENLPTNDAIQLFGGGAALVRDATTFGATGPVVGQRFRFEVAPNVGDLHMTNVTADFREYLMPKQPVTFALRLLHVARYGAGGEDSRLTPLFLGYSTLIRGWDSGTFRAGECTPTTNGSCPEFDRLLGSRLLVFNGEVRVPAVGLFTGRLDYGLLPVELMAFYDAGVAWTRDETPTFAGGDRSWVASAGFGARVNFLGFAVGEFNLAHPINRPGRGWIFVFNLRPGF
ncbi:MAG: BamA/TamA family outer membrane protein [Vicinamibacterales bacterium]